MSKFPDTITAWATIDGRYEFDTKQNLFPLDEPAEYMLSDARNAAIWFRNPDEFHALVDGFNLSVSDTIEGKMYDAFSYVILTSGAANE